MFWTENTGMKVACSLLVLWIGLTFGCRSSSTPTTEKNDYVAEIQRWHQQHIKELTSPDGWLALAGLFWLEEGEQRFGAHPSNDIVFPSGKAPDFIGSFIVHDGVVAVKINPGINVLHNGAPVQAMELQTDAQGDPTILTLGSLSWYIIERDGHLGVRLRDSQNPRLKEFKGIEMFPIDPAWRIEATFEPFEQPKSIAVPTILGTVTTMTSPGKLAFRIDGHAAQLIAFAKSTNDPLFVIFADETNGRETYGAGRFLYVDPPGADGKTFIDFNKAYNPPCAFTPYATCPLPPEGNRLPVRVTAGEKKYAGAHH